MIPGAHLKGEVEMVFVPHAVHDSQHRITSTCPVLDLQGGCAVQN